MHFVKFKCIIDLVLIFGDDRVATYYLFLDEIKANNDYSHFCLGGCIIEEMIYKKQIIPCINELKKKVFNNPLKILHEVDISPNNKSFWLEMQNLFTTIEFKTICVGVDYKKFRTIYKDKSQTISSEYYIALQIMLENYVHFLECTNGKGSVYIESRGNEPDIQLQEQYDLIRKQGTLFIPGEIFQNRLKTISFPMKIDNNIGVQIADFIPNPVARHFGGMEQKPYTLYPFIKNKAYDGNTCLIERFGIKKIL